MGKQWTVESPNRDYTGLRPTDFGLVQFKKGVAKTNKTQAEYLVNLGYFCDELDHPRPEKLPDELILVKVENAELKAENTELAEVKKDCLDKIADLQKRLQAAETKINEVKP